MRASLTAVLIVLALAPVAAAQEAQETQKQSESPRDVTREKLRVVLEAAGQLADVKTTFRQGDKEPYNFLSTIEDNLTHAKLLEIVIRVTPNDTLGFRVFPHYKDGYINIDKVKDKAGLMRTMLLFNDRNFLFWGVDEAGDIFSGYTITLESGFPDAAVETVVRSIRNTDAFVGTLRPYIDGSAKRK
ncbi:MAG TPA: hypothetical protein VFV49_15335 [Thermoanaerobaculia bacterium]|nr:hypothetical protein [Thermoanaerobaculia bacterium]